MSSLPKSTIIHVFMYLDQRTVLEYRPHMVLVFLFQTLMDALSSLHDRGKIHIHCRQLLLYSKLHHHSCNVQYWIDRDILRLWRFSSNSKMDIPLHILFDTWFMHYNKSSVIKRTKGCVISEGLWSHCQQSQKTFWDKATFNNYAEKLKSETTKIKFQNSIHICFFLNEKQYCLTKHVRIFQPFIWQIQ